jgi:hypothetical protein
MKPIFTNYNRNLKCISPDGLRACEIITGMHLMVTYQGIHKVLNVGRSNRFGEIMGNSTKRVPGDMVSKGTTVTEVVRDIMELFGKDAYMVNPNPDLRVDLMKRYGIPFNADWGRSEVTQFDPAVI